MKSIDLISTYWPQIVLLLGVIGYIIKSFNDVRIKKIETKYSHYQSLKITAISDFIVKVHLIEKSNNEVDYFQAFTNEITSEKYDELFFHRWREYDKSYSMLLFLLSSKEMTCFENINTNLKQVSKSFNDHCSLYTLRDEREAINKRTLSFTGDLYSLTNKNKLLLINAGKEFQKKYK